MLPPPQDKYINILEVMPIYEYLFSFAEWIYALNTIFNLLFLFIWICI